jgi:aspartyl-tRNA(Asn)/glutamyl-tRNA(Gln) amidotransferase subunit B
MKYADVSEANLYYGNMRFDVNVSVSKTGELGTRTETKNLNSFRSVEKTVEYETNRQIELLEKGEAIAQETRGWDDGKRKTFSQRTKEEAHDYRYMPDPDLPPVVLTDEYIEQIKADMPALPDDYRRILSEVGIDTKTVEDIIAVPDTAMTVKRVYEAANASHAKRVAFWLLQPASDEEEPAHSAGASEERAGEGGLAPSEAMVAPEKVSTVGDSTQGNLPGQASLPPRSYGPAEGGRAPSEKGLKGLIKLSQMVEDNKLSSTAAKEVLAELLKTGEDPEKIAEAKNLLQVSDEGEIIKIVDQVLAENEKAAADVKNGEMKAIGFLVGQVMKASKGKANPALATELIKKQLGI